MASPQQPQSTQQPRSRSTSRRRPKRSTTNLNHLSLAPLSTQTTHDSSVTDESGAQTPTRSYIAGKSAPTTPSILRSNNHSRTHLDRHGHGHGHHHGHVSYGKPHGDNSLPKAKSSAALLSQHNSALKSKDKAHRRTRTGDRIPASSLAMTSAGTQGEGDGWFERTGIALASEAREYKGQTWIATRESSTRLVADLSSSDSDGEGERVFRTPRGGSVIREDNDGIVTPRWTGSRPVSAIQSRRGSRVELHSNRSSGYFARVYSGQGSEMGEEAVEGPDFLVKEVDDGRGDDAEVERLTKESFGFGSMVDRVLAWPLFDPDEGREETETEGESSEKEKEASRKKRDAQSRVLPPVQKQSASADPNAEQPEGGWKDAAWLLSVASKVLF